VLSRVSLVPKASPSRNAERADHHYRRFRVSSADDPLRDPLPVDLRAALDLPPPPCFATPARPPARTRDEGRLEVERCRGHGRLVARCPENPMRGSLARGATSLKINSVKEPTDIRGASRGFRAADSFHSTFLSFSFRLSPLVVPVALHTLAYPQFDAVLSRLSRGCSSERSRCSPFLSFIVPRVDCFLTLFFSDGTFSLYRCSRFLAFAGQ